MKSLTLSLLFSLFIGIFLSAEIFAAQIPSVDTLVVEKEKFQRVMKYPAVVTPTVQGKLIPEISGTVTRIVKSLGAKVKKGETVFYLKNNQIGLNFNEYAVKAPVSGVVSKLDANVGRILKDGESGGDVVELSDVKWTAEIPARDLKQLEIGLQAYFYLDKQSYKAKVSALSPVVNPLTGTAQMELKPLESIKNLTVGAIGKMAVFLPEEAEITVPPEALVKLNLKKFVRKIENDTIRLNEVEIGDLVNGKQIITKGLKVKDEIVVKASDFLKEGDKIVRSQSQTVQK